VTIWIDPPAWPAHGRLWSHLISDESYAELHDFAAAQGIPSRGFEGDHYDVPEERHAALVAAGARLVGGRALARILRDRGLRIQKRTRERVISSVPDAPWLPPGSRADVIASRHESAPANTVQVQLALVRGEELFVVARPDDGLDLPTRQVANTAAAVAVEELHRSMLGVADVAAPRLLGYVRNTVPHASPQYPWPTPQACFAVFVQRRVLEVPAAGTWLDAQDARAALSGRHWWPLLADRESQ
jgi:hypothetical protein